MELMLAISVLVASLGWGFSAIHTQVHVQRENTYKKLWEGAIEASTNLAQERADIEAELEMADENYKMAMKQLEEVDSRLAGIVVRVKGLVEQPPIEQTIAESNDPVWKFVEDNRDLMPTWELLRGDGIASMPPHRRYSEFATFCANNAYYTDRGDARPPLSGRKHLEDAIEALG